MYFDVVNIVIQNNSPEARWEINSCLQFDPSTHEHFGVPNPTNLLTSTTLYLQFMIYLVGWFFVNFNNVIYIIQRI